MIVLHPLISIALAISGVLRNQRFSRIYESLCKLLLKSAIFKKAICNMLQINWYKKTRSAYAKAGCPLFSSIYETP